MMIWVLLRDFIMKSTALLDLQIIPDAVVLECLNEGGVDIFSLLVQSQLQRRLNGSQEATKPLFKY